MGIQFPNPIFLQTEAYKRYFDETHVQQEGIPQKHCCPALYFVHCTYVLCTYVLYIKEILEFSPALTNSMRRYLNYRCFPLSESWLLMTHSSAWPVPQSPGRRPHTAALLPLLLVVNWHLRHSGLASWLQVTSWQPTWLPQIAFSLILSYILSVPITLMSKSTIETIVQNSAKYPCIPLVEFMLTLISKYILGAY